MSEVPIEPCRGCGTPKRIDTECAASEECIVRNRQWRLEQEARMRRTEPT
jgi:hypothetical protein